MSYTTLMAIYPEEQRVEDFMELRNSSGSAPPVWMALCEQYVGHRFFWLHHKEDDLRKLWDLWKDKTVPLHRRVVLMMTFDRFYVASKHYGQAIRDIELFFREFPIPRENANHWPSICLAMRQHPEIPGFGLHCTSVGDNPWRGSWNEDEEEYDPLDWSGVREVYDELNRNDSGT